MFQILKLAIIVYTLFIYTKRLTEQKRENNIKKTNSETKLKTY